MNTPIEDDPIETDPVDFYIYFDTDHKASADKLALSLRASEFIVAVHYTELTKQWLVLATSKPESLPIGFGRLVDVMQRLAEDYGGFFDGWERLLFSSSDEIEENSTP